MKKKIILTFMVLSLSALTFGCGKKVDDGNTPTTKDDVSTEASTGQTTELDTEVTTEQSTEQEEDDYNPNGYGFSIGQDCLKVYLDYVSDGMAEWDYERAVKEDNREYKAHVFKYFSIAGMAGEEPFLLLSSSNGSDCADDTYFVTYTPYDYSGEGREQTNMQGNYEFFYGDNLSMRQYVQVNTIYVWASNPKTEARFIQRVDMCHINDYDDDSKDTYSYDGAELSCNEKGRTYSRDVRYEPSYYEEKLASGELMEIKWFSIDQIEEARAYYQQYVREEVYDGPVESANRDDYFNDGTVLKYFDYISEGEFSVSEDGDGDTEYTFSCLEYETSTSIFYKLEIPNSVYFMSGSDSQDVRYDFIPNSDNSWTIVRRHRCSNQYGMECTLSYETNENEVVMWYNGSENSFDDASQATSIEDVIERLKEEQ